MNRHSSSVRLLLGMVLALAVVLMGSGTVLAGETICTGTLGAITVDDLSVPQYATCTLNGTKVEGNIKVETDATLQAYGVRVDGNVQSDGASLINIHANSWVGGAVQVKYAGQLYVYHNTSVGDSIQAERVNQVNVYPGVEVGGSIQIKQSGGAIIEGVDVNQDILLDTNNRALVVRDNTIGGNLQVFQNTRGGITLTRNTIDGNLQANQNTDGLLITFNVIEENLTCQANVPPPTGWQNTVRGSMEDQCRGFNGPAPVTPTATPTATRTPTATPSTTVGPSPTPTPSPTVGPSATPTPSTTPVSTVTSVPTSTTAPVLTINFGDGRPGSYFTLSGSRFPPGSTATISVNNRILGSIATDANGNLMFLLSTGQADVGQYVVTVTVNPTASVRFTLASNAPLRPQQGAGAIYNVPGGAADLNLVYLPLVLR